MNEREVKLNAEAERKIRRAECVLYGANFDHLPGGVRVRAQRAFAELKSAVFLLDAAKKGRGK